MKRPLPNPYSFLMAIFLICFAQLAIAETLGPISVKNYGAYGDGVHNDTAAINNAIAVASQNGGGQVYLPAGNYLTSSSLNMKSNVALVGDGRDISFISPQASSGDAIVLAG